MKKIRRKIVLACTAVMMLLLTTVTTTFAWFSLNESAWLEGMELEINNMENLLITADSIDDVDNMKFKQYLTAEDIVKAINEKRKTDGKNAISSLSEIKLSPVTTVDGLYFEEIKTTYNENNKKEIEFVEADANHYISFTISFIVENNGEDQPDYELFFMTGNTDTESEELKSTLFNAKDQKISLVHDLFDGAAAMKPGDIFGVNPVNSLRMAVTNHKTSTITSIYDLGESDEVKGKDVLAANHGGVADAATAEENAMYTYYNNVNNLDGVYANKLPVMSDYSVNVGTGDFNEPIGTFTPESESRYSIVTLDITIWIEGYDADSIIGLNTSDITMLLTFGVEKK